MAPPRRVFRSRKEKVLAGVCSGLATYFELDPTLVRILWVLGTIFTGVLPGLVAYLVVALIMPLEPENAPPSTPTHETPP